LPINRRPAFRYPASAQFLFRRRRARIARTTDRFYDDPHAALERDLQEGFR
jgi:hypothetical protein